MGGHRKPVLGSGCARRTMTSGPSESRRAGGCPHRIGDSVRGSAGTPFAGALMRPSSLPRSRRQHRNQDTVLQNEVVKQGRGRMQARQPDQSIAEPGMNLGDCSAEPTGGRKKGPTGPIAASVSGCPLSHAPKTAEAGVTTRRIDKTA